MIITICANLQKMNTLAQIFTDIANLYPHKIAVQIKTTDGYRKFNYQQLWQLSQHIAYTLKTQGHSSGEKIAIILENSLEWVAIYFAIMFLGAIAVPIDSEATLQEIEFILDNSGTTMVFASAHSASTLQKLSLRLQIITTSDQLFMEDIPIHSEYLVPNTKPADIASVLYTSGTTGKPKGVMLTHQNLCANFHSIKKINLINDQHNMLGILPFHHSFPFMVNLIIPLFSGNTVTIISTLKSDEILACMRDTDVTVLIGVPQFFIMLAKQIHGKITNIPLWKKLPLLFTLTVTQIIRKTTKINLAKLLFKKVHSAFGKSLQFFICGGAKLDIAAIKLLNKVGFTILEGYGLTEASPIVAFNPPDVFKIGSAGKAIPDVQIKIVNPDNENIGEIAVAGVNVMAGYYLLPEETNAVLHDGWLYTGDLGYLDTQGYLYITGRKKELIVLSSGKNIAPEEIENYYQQCPFIKEMCVLTKNEQASDQLSAVIVPNFEHFRKIGKINIHNTLKWELENLSKHYAAYKRIMGFIITAQPLPRTRLGKLQRFAISAQFNQELTNAANKQVEPELTIEDLTVLAKPLANTIINILRTVTNSEKIITPHTHLELDLGIDSLKRIELLVLIEQQLQIKIPEAHLKIIFSVGDLINTVEQLVIKENITISQNISIEAFWQNTLKTDPVASLRSKISLKSSFCRWIAVLFFSGILKSLLKLFWNLKVTGIENLPINRPFILCPNHVSYLDGFAIAAAIPFAMREHLYFLGEREIFETPIIRRLMKSLHIIPIDPAINLIEAMQASAFVLRNKKAICIFPEGARSIDGKLHEFRKGAGILAKELDIVVVPAIIQGAYELWPRTQKLPKIGTIEVVFGKPCAISELISSDNINESNDIYTTIVTGIKNKVSSLKQNFL